jgi:hypothetical protein
MFVYCRIYTPSIASAAATIALIAIDVVVPSCDDNKEWFIFSKSTN